MLKIDMEIRQAVMQCVIGKIGRLITPVIDHAATMMACQDFARSRLIKLEFKVEGDLIKMRTLSKLTSSLKYSEVDSLQVGESYLFEVPVDQHQNIRSNMVYRTKRNGHTYRCEVDVGGLRVTRVPNANDKQGEFILDTRTARATKYGLERLHDVDRVLVNIERFEHDRVRLAAHRIAVRNDWNVSCRVQPDGSMLVMRVKEADAATTKVDQYALARMLKTNKIQITLPRTEHASLRVAVSRYAQRNGITIRCRYLGGETMQLDRVDSGAPRGDAQATSDRATLGTVTP